MRHNILLKCCFKNSRLMWCNVNLPVSFVKLSSSTDNSAFTNIDQCSWNEVREWIRSFRSLSSSPDEWISCRRIKALAWRHLNQKTIPLSSVAFRQSIPYSSSTRSSFFATFGVSDVFDLNSFSASTAVWWKSAALKFFSLRETMWNLMTTEKKIGLCEHSKPTPMLEFCWCNTNRHQIGHTFHWFVMHATNQRRNLASQRASIVRPTPVQVKFRYYGGNSIRKLAIDRLVNYASHSGKLSLWITPMWIVELSVCNNYLTVDKSKVLFDANVYHTARSLLYYNVFKLCPRFSSTTKIICFEQFWFRCIYLHLFRPGRLHIPDRYGANSARKSCKPNRPPMKTINKMSADRTWKS